ncbi:uncharacterized protein BHQ10_005129 [Talaromyces amestolkiae]|uniref:Uncharacterized protein n=1 Tax=Talaromyces amestolkiae TaxID=1196081 RepID=A0A364KZX7_TALAM|nr:uncharacterized protein BHQ10_005129 [Talaromyces amestolkiae]RAO69117.1 hypothetical protein BHQ10_005129 [Talaromyces amestolkiae]
MRSFPKALSLLLFNAATTVKADSSYDASLYYRPSNISASLISLYTWIGSYYNATAQVDFEPYNVSSSIQINCPALTTYYTARLGLTKPGPFNSADDPINAFLTLWPLDFNFTGSLNSAIVYNSGLDFYLFSSDPFYQYDTGNATNNWNWSLSNTTSSPYNLSGTVTEGYQDSKGFSAKTFTSCAYGSTWGFRIYSGPFQSDNFTQPTINLEFDGWTAKLTLQGYAEGSLTYEDRLYVGEFRLVLSAVIDEYHSDILQNDTSTPTWLRTVGYNNNPANIGYTKSDSTKSHLSGFLLLTTIASGLWLVIR